MGNFGKYGTLTLKVLREKRPTVASKLEDNFERTAALMKSVNSHFINRALYHADAYQAKHPTPVNPEERLRYILNREAYTHNEVVREVNNWVNNYVPDSPEYEAPLKKLVV